jgi:hypothetical protein
MIVKALFLVLLAVEGVLLVTAISPVFINSHAAERAVIAAHDNPTPESIRNAEQWRERIRCARSRSHLVVWSLLALNTGALAVAGRGIRTQPARRAG